MGDLVEQSLMYPGDHIDTEDTTHQSELHILSLLHSIEGLSSFFTRSAMFITFLFWFELFKVLLVHVCTSTGTSTNTSTGISMSKSPVVLVPSNILNCSSFHLLMVCVAVVKDYGCLCYQWFSYAIAISFFRSKQWFENSENRMSKARLVFLNLIIARTLIFALSSLWVKWTLVQIL